MLHIIDNFPFESSMLEQAACGDTILFVENAVYAVQRSARGVGLLKKAVTHLNCCVFGPDLEARGVAANQLLRGVSVIDEKDYEDLTEDNFAVKSWN